MQVIIYPWLAGPSATICQTHECMFLCRCNVAGTTGALQYIGACQVGAHHVNLWPLFSCMFDRFVEPKLEQLCGFTGLTYSSINGWVAFHMRPIGHCLARSFLKINKSVAWHGMAWHGPKPKPQLNNVKIINSYHSAGAGGRLKWIAWQENLHSKRVPSVT